MTDILAAPKKKPDDDLAWFYQLVKDYVPPDEQLRLIGKGELRFDPYLFGRATRDKDEIHVVVSEVTDDGSKMCGAIRLTREQWLNLKEVVDKIVHFHDRHFNAH